MPMFDVVLFQPEIPPNTGNAIRMCANAGCRLHLVEPLGFAIDDARLRRAGLDYHELTVMQVHADWVACLNTLRAAHAERAPGTALRLHLLTTRATRTLRETRFLPGDVLVFGQETRGLPDWLLDEVGAGHWLKIPMRPGNRSLNLSNAAAVVVFEAWRQQDYAGMG